MKRAHGFLFVLLMALLLGLIMTAVAQAPLGWQKVSGPARGYSGVADGIMGDRENSYAWSMEVFGNYLYVGTNRNVVGSMLTRFLPLNLWPATVPVPTDSRARIYRMKLSTRTWELFYLAPPTQPGPPVLGLDDGYRMMECYTAHKSSPVLYVGSMGSSCRLLAIDRNGKEPVPVFTITNPGTLPFGFSIRAIAEHEKKLYWASDYYDSDMKTVYPAIWYAADPLKEYTRNNAVVFPRIDVPKEWFPRGSEIMDLISYNGYLYVFFLNHDITPANMGFWVAKCKWKHGAWQWQLIVGDTGCGAKYPCGLGSAQDAGATSPTLFKGKIYVGTGSATMIKFFVTGQIDTGGADVSTIGAKIFRFDKHDTWERVVPPAMVTNGSWNGFYNPLNQYTWRLCVQGDKLSVGTFDARTLLEQFGPLLNFELPTMINPAGFDLYSTSNGTTWFPASLSGFGDPFNYGGRSFATDPRTGDMYLGTANPFYGCQIWKKRGSGS